MAGFFSSPLMLSVGLVILILVIIALFIWLLRLSRNVSDLREELQYEQRRVADLANFMNRRNQSLAGQPQQSVIPPHASARQQPTSIPARLEEEEPRKESKRRGRNKPVIPFGENKTAKERIHAQYTDEMLDNDYEPDSIDFSRVRQSVNPGVEVPVITVAPNEPSPMRYATGPMGYQHPEPHPHMRVPEIQQPRQRPEEHVPRQPYQGRTPSSAAQRATAQTRAGFEEAGSYLRDQGGASTAWIAEDERRMSERMARQERLARMSAEREQAQLRRRAESIVQRHRSSMEE